MTYIQRDVFPRLEEVAIGSQSGDKVIFKREYLTLKKIIILYCFLERVLGEGGG